MPSCGACLLHRQALVMPWRAACLVPFLLQCLGNKNSLVHSLLVIVRGPQLSFGSWNCCVPREFVYILRIESDSGVCSLPVGPSEWCVD